MKNNRTLQDLNEQYKDCPVQENDYVIDGTMFRVRSHFAGTQKLSEIIYRYAFHKALDDILHPVPQIAES